MKKLLSILLAVCMCFSLCILFTSCDEDDPFAGITKEVWEEYIAESNFENVTINYVFATEAQGTQTHVVKITEDKLYRAVSMVMGDQTYEDDVTFTGDEAASQRKLFIDIFLELLANRADYEYDEEKGVYKSPKPVVKNLEIEGQTITETMTNGEVKFDSKGNLVYFTCHLVESTTWEGQTHETVGNVEWHFSDFGTTVIEDAAE